MRTMLIEDLLCKKVSEGLASLYNLNVATDELAFQKNQKRI